MQPDKSPPEVADRLAWYVYRLIGSRNGETFYVGKGRDNRVVQHAKAALATTQDEDETDLKFQRIKNITAAGLEVGHMIHRHGIHDPDVAYQIEADDDLPLNFHPAPIRASAGFTPCGAGGATCDRRS